VHPRFEAPPPPPPQLASTSSLEGLYRRS
jgi:hypothetical protein